VPPEPDTERQPFNDLLRFTVRSQDLDFHLERDGHYTLVGLNSCKNLQELAQLLIATGALGFFWIDLLIGIKLEYGHQSWGSWGAREIWWNAMRPWANWV
jgi:hypothetical protein